MAGDRDPIANTGLAERLEQHSRQNGIALGVAMALCMVIGIAGFIYLYTHINILPDARSRLPDPPTVSSGSAVAGAQFTTPAASRTVGTPGANATALATLTVGTATPAVATMPSGATMPAPSGTPTTPGPTATPTFKANYRIVGGPSINLRREPGTTNAIVRTLPPGTELQWSGQSQEVGADKWLRLRDQSGSEGWVREIDLEKIPG